MLCQHDIIKVINMPKVGVGQIQQGMAHFQERVLETCKNKGTAKHRLLVQVKAGMITRVATDDEQDRLLADEFDSSSRQSHR